LGVFPSIKRNQFGLLLRYRIPIKLNFVRLWVGHVPDSLRSACRWVLVM